MSEIPTPEFNAKDHEKMGACLAIMPLVFDTLQSYNPGKEISADDIIDFHALCIAAILENDTHITTPKQTKDALLTVTTFVKRWVRTLRGLRDPDGASFLKSLIDWDRKERGPVKH